MVQNGCLREQKKASHFMFVPLKSTNSLKRNRSFIWTIWQKPYLPKVSLAKDWHFWSIRFHLASFTGLRRLSLRSCPLPISLLCRAKEAKKQNKKNNNAWSQVIGALSKTILIKILGALLPITPFLKKPLSTKRIDPANAKLISIF